VLTTFKPDDNWNRDFDGLGCVHNAVGYRRAVDNATKHIHQNRFHLDTANRENAQPSFIVTSTLFPIQ